MQNSIHQKVRLTSDQIRNLPAFRKARRLILRLEVAEGRVHGRGRTLIPPRRMRIRTQTRIRARRSPASQRRATTDSGGDDGGGSGDPEPEPARPSKSKRICGGIAPRIGGAL